MGRKKATVSMQVVDTAMTCMLYIASCIGMSCFQKMAIIVFPKRNVLICLQAGSVLLLLLMFRWRSIHLGPHEDFWRFLPICLAFTLMLMASMIAYQYCTLGTIVVIGAICPLLTLPVEMLAFRRHPLMVTWHTVGSMVLTVVGVALYGVFQNKLGGQLFGISAMVGKTIINVYYQTRMRYLMVEDPVDINDEGMMLYNNGIALLATVATVFATGEHAGIQNSASAMTQWGYTWIVCSCMFCYAISYFSFRCQRVVSATSFHILGNVSKVVVVLFGWVALGEGYTVHSALAVALALVGAAWYSWDRVMDEHVEEKAFSQGYVPLSDDAAHLSPFITGGTGSVSRKGMSGAGRGVGYTLRLPPTASKSFPSRVPLSKNAENEEKAQKSYQERDIERGGAPSSSYASAGSLNTKPSTSRKATGKIPPTHPNKNNERTTTTTAAGAKEEEGKQAKDDGSSSSKKKKKKKKDKKKKFVKKVPRYATATLKRFNADAMASSSSSNSNNNGASSYHALDRESATKSAAAH